MELSGFDHLINICQKLGLTIQLYSPAGHLPDTQEELGVALDPCLNALLLRINGGRLWDLYLYGGSGSPNELLSINKDIRLISDDIPSLADFVLFAQVGHQATHLAVIPALASAEGLQPVAYLDLNENMKVLPLSSNVDRSFDLIARYLEHLVAKSDDIEQGAMELLFPWDVPELIAADKDLLQLVNQGRFDRYVEADPDVRNFLDRICQQAR